MKNIDPNQDNTTVFTELYYEISEFMKIFGPLLNAHLTGTRRQRPFCRMSVCEIMTVLIGFQIIGGQNFRQYYKDTVLQFHRVVLRFQTPPCNKPHRGTDVRAYHRRKHR